MIKLIIFDLWNTLAYKDKNNNSVATIAKEFGLRLAHRKLVKIFENSLQTKKWKSEYSAYRNLCRNFGIEESKVNVEELMRIRETREGKAKLYVYVIPMLKSLRKQGYKIGLISNTSLFSVKYIRKTKVLDYVDYSVFSFDVGFIKPELKAFREILRRAKVKANEAIMIGDKIGDDVVPPRKIGMNSLHFQGYSKLKKDFKKFGIIIKV